MKRREFLLGAAASLAAIPSARAALQAVRAGSLAADDVATSSSPGWRPIAARIRRCSAERYERYKVLLSFNDLWTPREKRAFLMTPREEFVLPEDRDNAYVGHYLDIGFGVTITPPGTMGRMTSALGIQPGDKVLEIGTGSGYQSALLSYLTTRSDRSRSSPNSPRAPAASTTG